MRRKLALVTTGLLAGATLSVAAGTPAHACHNDIILSENPIHNWICMTVHETGVEDRIAGYYQELYCVLTQDPACS